jgi:holo-[acyl-carrier protein] synthase
MSIIGVGIDIVVIKELSYLVQRSAGRFESRCFTLAELNTAGTGASRIAFLAENFAAKEAVLKALGTGWSQDISWTDIELWRSSVQAPYVLLHRRAEEIASDLGIGKWMVCVSRSKIYAIASAIALSQDEPKGVDGCS